MDWNKIHRGDINGLPVFVTLKKAMLELLKGYPIFRYYGIFESYFGGVAGHDVVKIIEGDGFIDVIREDGKQPLYRITSKGIDLAISMINLDYSEETSKYNNIMHRLTVWIIVLTVIMAIMGLVQVIPTIIKFISS